VPSIQAPRARKQIESLNPLASAKKSRNDEELRVERAIDAERLEDVDFANTLTNTRRAGPSLRHRGVY